MTLRLGILGPLCLVVDGEEVEVPGPRRRAVLAMLATTPGRVVPGERLLDAVWPDEVPASGRRALHSHMSRLRGHLGPAAGRLSRDGEGYSLDLRPGELDAAEARELASAAAQAAPADAVRLLARALGLWRGAALVEFPDVAPLAAEAVALAELHSRLTDDWLEARLAAASNGGNGGQGRYGGGNAGPGNGGPGNDSGAGQGADAELLADAGRAAAEAPLRERTHAVLVRALAAAGRQAEALRAAHAFRHRLADETGLSPGEAFDAMEQDVALGVLAPVATSPTRTPPPARPSSPIVGRDYELATLRRHVTGHRLTSVVGPGGVGKTRLVMEVVATHADHGAADGAPTEIVVVELATVEDAGRVADALADAVGARARGGGQAMEACIDALASQRTLVLLDNCEHVIAAARDMVATLLARCRDLTVVVTSREPLGLPDEHLLRLGPLPVPEEGATDIGRSPAVAAFLAHARRRIPDLAVDEADAPLVAELARRLDGLPLALELAAGRVGTLALPDLHARLDRALDLFSAGRASASARHRTLRAAIDWSYRSLDEDAQRLLRALGVFPGGVDLATAERLGSRLGLTDDPAAVLAGLVEASVLVADPAAGRYRALETVRAFAVDALRTAGEDDRAEAEMVAWAVDLAGVVDGWSRGPDEARADAALHAELPNFAAAWAAAGRRRDLDARVALVLRLDQLRTYRGEPALQAWTRELADDPSLPTHPDALTVLGSAAQAAWTTGDLDRAASLAHQALAPGSGPEAASRALGSLAAVDLFRGDPRAASDQWEEAAGLVPPTEMMWYLGPAGLAAHYAGDAERARSLLGRADASGVGAAPSSHAFVHYARAEVSAGTDPAAATEHYGRAIAVARGCGATFVEGVASVGLVRLWAAEGRTRQALAGYGTLLEAWRRSGHWVQLWTTLRNLAGPLADVGQASTAALVLAAVDSAPNASAVTAATVAAELAELTDRLRHELGDDAYATARQLGARLSRTDVVDAALSAVHTALAAR